jgi:EmrB/QacA subfamily drug resistance transporter
MSSGTDTQLTAAPSGLLATRRGKAILGLLCAVAFVDFVGVSIVNVALPTIRHDLGFSVQNLQWVLSGYLLTYGGFLLLGGRAADLLGRRRMLVAGTILFAVASLAAGLADNQGTLVAARLAQGVGAAIMSPAGLSLVTTLFAEGSERNKAIGAWGAMAGLGPAVGVLGGGLLSGGPGWRWVFFVNLPVCGLIVVGAFRLLAPDARQSVSMADFDAPGAALVTEGMLLLVYALVRAPDVGWGAVITIGELVGAGVLLGGFLFNEARHRNPLVPLSIFRIPGLAAANATQVIAMAGFYSMFFFVTLYMQVVLRYSPIQTGLAYLPVSVGIGAASGIAVRLMSRTGTRLVIVVGTLIASGAVYWLSRIPINGSYPVDLLGPLFVMALGFGLAFVGVQTAANAGVPADKAGLAAALINTSYQLGGALGLAIFSAIATAHTQHLLSNHTPGPAALTAGFQWGLVASSISLLGAALIAMRATNVRGENRPTNEPTSLVTETP